MGAGVVVFGEELADLLGGCRCSSWAGDGGLDDGGQMQDFLALVTMSMLWADIKTVASLPSWPRQTRRRVATIND